MLATTHDVRSPSPLWVSLVRGSRDTCGSRSESAHRCSALTPSPGTDLRKSHPCKRQSMRSSISTSVGTPNATWTVLPNSALRPFWPLGKACRSTCPTGTACATTQRRSRRRDSRPAPVATTFSRGEAATARPSAMRGPRTAGNGLDLPEEGAPSGSAKRIGGRVGLWRPQGSLSPPWGTIGWLARLSHLTAQDSAERRIYLTRGKTETRCGAARAAWRRQPAPSGYPQT